MNETMSIAGKHALTAPQFVSLPHRCQQWARQVYELVYGQEFEKYRRENARLTALAWRASPYNVPLERGSVIGDLLYKTHGSGGDGHVGIRINGNRVAENSSLHFDDDDDDARGIRTLREFGHFDVIIRLPFPTPTQFARFRAKVDAQRRAELDRI
jgi:hypothetical protein